MAKVRPFSKLRAKPTKPFRFPASKIRRQAVESIRVFPDTIPLGPDEDALLEARYQPWRQATNGSLPEFIAWEYLTRKRKLTPGVDFIFQSPFFGGRTKFGGFVLDFMFPQRAEGWMIQGERFHLRNPADRAKNGIVQALLRSRGIRAIQLWENDLLTRPDFVLDAAWFRSVEVAKKSVV